MRKSHLLGVVWAILFTAFTVSANAALVGRLETSPGSGFYQAYYDDQLDITWAANANINGQDTWDNQLAWAASLTIGGVDNWRVASMDVDGNGFVVDCWGGGGGAGCEDNELMFLYWEEGITGATPGPFSNVQSATYWSESDGSGITLPPGEAWNFSFSSGEWFFDSKSALNFAWAVHDGDVVPIPASIWLFGSGLLGLIGVTRRKKAE